MRFLLLFPSFFFLKFSFLSSISLSFPVACFPLLNIFLIFPLFFLLYMYYLFIPLIFLPPFFPNFHFFFDLFSIPFDIFLLCYFFPSFRYIFPWITCAFPSFSSVSLQFSPFFFFSFPVTHFPLLIILHHEIFLLTHLNFFFAISLKNLHGSPFFFFPPSRLWNFPSEILFFSQLF